MTDERNLPEADELDDERRVPDAPDVEPTEAARPGTGASGVEAPAPETPDDASVTDSPAVSAGPSDVAPGQGTGGTIVESLEGDVDDSGAVDAAEVVDSEMIAADPRSAVETVTVVPAGGQPQVDSPRADIIEETAVEADVTEEVPFVDAVAEPPAPVADRFTWHPDHAGKTFDEVREELAQEIASDQRQHRLAMEGAEEAEQDALASVVVLERKWGVFDFDWAEQEPRDLADRIVAFEREREQRRQMITWAAYRAGGVEHEAGVYETGERPAPELSSGAKALSLLLVVLLIALILIAVWAL